jgi:hypothetical protein
MDRSKGNGWWLSASDKLKKGSFRWCFPHKSEKMKMSLAISFTKGRLGRPDGLTGNNRCLLLSSDGLNFHLLENQCDSRSGYICEVNIQENSSFANFCWISILVPATANAEHESGNTTDLCPRYNCDKENVSCTSVRYIAYLFAVYWPIAVFTERSAQLVGWGWLVISGIDFIK